MKIDYVKTNDVVGEITMVVDENDYAGAVQKQLKEIGKKHAEPGFRPGHVPAGLIARKYGKAVRYDEINKVVGDALVKYFEDNKINVLGRPVPDKENVINDDATEFTFKFKVGVAPEFDTKVDKDMHIPYYKITVSDEMIERQDNALRRRFGKQEPGDEVDATALVKGVITELNADSTVKEGGVVVENGIVAPQYFKSDDQRQIFIGHHVGDSIVFNPAATCDNNATELSSMLKVSKDVADKYQGDFRFDIKEIIVLKLAELNEEFFKEAFGDTVKDEAGYREAVKKMIETSLTGDQNYRFTIDAEKVIRDTVGELVLPDDVLKQFLIDTNESLNADNIDAEYVNIRRQLVWDIEKEKIRESFNVEVDANDLKETASIMARNQFAQYGMTNVPDDAIEHYADEILKDEKARDNVYRQTLDMKLFKAIHDAVTLDEKVVSVEEFNDLFRAEAKTEENA